MAREGVRSPGAATAPASTASGRAAAAGSSSTPVLDSDGMPIQARPRAAAAMDTTSMDTSDTQALAASDNTPQTPAPQVLVDARAFAALAAEVHRRVDTVERRLDRTLQDDGSALRVWLQMSLDAQSQRIRVLERQNGALVERVQALEGGPVPNGRTSAKQRDGARVPATALLARRALLGEDVSNELKGDEHEWGDTDGDYEYVGQPICRTFDGKVVIGKVTGFLRQLAGPPVWHACHDDGDSEDLEHDEVVQGLRAFAEYAAATSRRAQRDRFARLANDPSMRVPDALGAGSFDQAVQAWTTSTRSRVVLLERLRAHCSRHEGARVQTSFFFELPVDTQRYGDYESRVSSSPICLRDIGDRLHAGTYTTPEHVDADLRRVFQNCRDYNPEGSVVREFGDALARLAERWVADYQACVALVGEAQLCVDARPYASLLAAGCGRCRQRGCPDCAQGLPDLCVARACSETGAVLNVCAFLPAVGLNSVCALVAARGAEQGSAAARAAAPFSGPPPSALLATPARPPAPPPRKRARDPSLDKNGRDPNGHRPGRSARAFSADL